MLNDITNNLIQVFVYSPVSSHDFTRYCLLLFLFHSLEILVHFMYSYNNKHLLDETKSNIRFVLLEQVMLGEAKLSLIPHSHQKLSCLKSGVSYSLSVSLPINQE